MTKIHPPIEDLPAGDGWKLVGTLQDRQGAALDLSGATAIEWALVSAKRVTVASAAVGDGIVVTDAAAGKIEITISPAASAAVAAGNYQDYLRVTIGGVPQTFWRGPATVTFSPFAEET